MRRSPARVSKTLVSVSRVMSNQRRQPAAWTQRSRNGPLGLSRMNRYSAHSRVGERVRVRRVGDAGLAAVAELGLVARPAPRAAGSQRASVGHGGRAVLVDQRAGREALQRERPVELVRLAVRDGVRPAPSPTPAWP